MKARDIQVFLDPGCVQMVEKPNNLVCQIRRNPFAHAILIEHPKSFRPDTSYCHGGSPAL
jgi:hypothetical protein